MTGLTQVLWIVGVLTTFALGFVVATMGFRGTQILVAYLAVVAMVTLVLRLVIRGDGAQVGPVRADRFPPSPIRSLVQAETLAPLLTTGAFFFFWSTAANTLGSFGTYFLIRITGLSQSQATGIVLGTFPLALILAVCFVRLADSVWRDRLFAVAMVFQVSAFAIGALSRVWC